MVIVAAEEKVMFCRSIIFLYSLLASFALFACATDNPCAVRQTDAGFVCVCNETYCDEINRAHPKKGTFVHYMTSEHSPGFTKTVGKLHNSTIREHAYNNVSTDVYIQVTDSIQFQTFIGLGASITENAAIAINSLGPGAQEKFMESCFGYKGVEFSLLRVPVAASDFSQKIYTYDDVPGDVDLKNFSLNEVDYKIMIPFIEMAQNISKRGIKLLGTPWSAPDWMKTNNGSTMGYLYTKYMGVWSKYLLKFLESYKNEGIDFWGLTPCNEPILPVMFGSFFPIQNTIMLPNQAREFIKCMGPVIKQKFKDLKIFMLEDERPFVSWYSDRVLADEEAAQYIDGVALHWYMDTKESLSNLEKFHDSYPGKDIIYSESSITGFQTSGGSVDLGDWSRAAQYIENIMQNLVNWVVGYIDWNIALNTDGGPTGPAQMTLDAQLIINMTNGEFYKQPIHYALGHFSKFIYVGARRINTTIHQDIPEINEDNPSLELSKLKDIMGSKNNGPQTKGQEPSSPKETTPTPIIEGPPTTPTGDPTGGPPTGGPSPPQPPKPADKIVSALAAKNPDGTRTLIVYNPRSDQLNVTVADAELGTFQATIDPKSINTFCYK